VGGTILVIEDDPQNQYLVRFLLEQSGFEVIVASDGEAGVDLALSRRPEMVLMDMLLPKLDGYEATKLIKADETFTAPVIALTAYSMKGDRERVLSAGCDGYISKPIDPETFVSRVMSFLVPRLDGSARA